MNTSARKPSALRRVVSDPVSRRGFLALTGGTTAAGALLAACGNDDDEGDATAATTEDDMASQFGEGDLGSSTTRSPLSTSRRPSTPTSPRADCSRAMTWR